MADISDVTKGLAEVIGTVVYPDGEDAASITGAAVKIYPGWTNEAALDADLKAGVCHVSVFNLARMDKDRTNLENGWMEVPGPAKAYDLAVLGNTITVSGAAPEPFHRHNIAVSIGTPVPALYSPEPGEDALSVAANLGAAIAVLGAGVVVNGTDITVAEPFRVTFARVGTVGHAIQEVSRSEKGWQITVWAPNPDLRTLLGKAIKPALDAVPFLAVGGDFSCRIRPAGATDGDDASRPGAYRRDLIYTVEVPTTLKVEAPEIVAFQTALQGPAGEPIADRLD